MQFIFGKYLLSPRHENILNLLPERVNETSLILASWVLCDKTTFLILVEATTGFNDAKTLLVVTFACRVEAWSS